MKKLSLLVGALLFVVTALCFTSCRAPRMALETQTRDTVERTVTVIKRDTVLIAPSASTVIQVPFKDLLNGQTVNITKREKQATITLRSTADGKQLEAQCDCDTVAITAELRDRYEREKASSVVTKTIKVPEPFTPWYVSVLAWAGGIAILCLLIGLVANRFLPARPS